ALVRGPVGELHRDPEAVAILRADLGEKLERLDARDQREPLGSLQEVSLGRRPFRMGQGERHGMPDAPGCHLAEPASARISASVCRGVIASGSTLSSRRAGRLWARARSNAPGKSSERSTTSPYAPKACAQAAKSGLTRSVPTTRPGKRRSWCIRIVPYIPLLTTSTTIDSSSWTAPASSCPLMRKSPSPETQTTVRSGWTTLAAIAAGMP